MSSVQGAKWKAQPGSGVQREMEEALDTELDAYLDRELSVQPDPALKPSPAAEKSAERLQSVLSMAAEEEQWLRTLPPPEAPAESAIELEAGECPIPAHLKPKPAPEVELAPPAEALRPETSWVAPPAPLPGLAAVPYLSQPGQLLPVALVPAPAAPNRTLWVVSGVLVGVSTASLLVVGMLWMVRNSLPDRTQVAAAYMPAGSVTAVQPPPSAPAPEPVLSVKDSPRSRPPEPLVADWHATTEGATSALPGPVVPGRLSASREPPPAPAAPTANPEPQAAPTPGTIVQAAASAEPKAVAEPVAIARAAQQPSRPVEATGGKAPAVTRSSEPLVASTKAETVKPRETAQARRAPATQERQARRDLEDPPLEDTQEETPFMQPPPVAPAPVAKAEPPPAAPPETSEYDEFDKEFARKLGFTGKPVQKAPESKGVKSVWIPPAPGETIQESLTPEDIQKVVVTNQPAITSCIRRNKDAIPGLSGGKFMMRWFVSPDGSTYGVAMETQALRGTALATCIEGLVKDWKFPKHQNQMGPIRFPFIF
ncbi:MAG: AgmX/PglI C-terminal domain-containing protein [Hyalangium sp.]|uniref:AgmX/PglI C-terminal domain-containing protein n=1 Tax=Hyalangium sp. TaxID=2028555 RepID=UPI00389B38B1